jgi:L-gulonolactone oxidase
MRIVTGTGAVQTITEQDNALLEAARINVGALGIITELTLDCVPHYQLEYTAYLTTFDEVIDKIDTLNQENERMLLWWFIPPIGPRDKVILVTKNPPGHPAGILSEAENLLLPLPDGVTPVPLARDAEILANLALGTDTTHGFKKILRFTADYDRVLTIPLLPVFHRECEYAIPVENTADALLAFRKVIIEGDFSLRLPVEVRFVANDRILLSPANDRDVAYIGASTLTNATEVFERFEPIMKDNGGRPHWGKNFTLTRNEVVELYGPSLDEFIRVRRQFDPDNIFVNSFVRDFFE